MACKTNSEYLPLDQLNRPTVTTEEAAFYLNRKPQTLRAHASRDTGVVKPLRINGRLAYSVADLRRVLGVVA